MENIFDTLAYNTSSVKYLYENYTEYKKRGDERLAGYMLDKILEESKQTIELIEKLKGESK